MADLPAGTSFGTLVHAVLETTDPQAPDLAAELRERCAEQIARRAAPSTPDQLAAGAAAGAAARRWARSPTACTLRDIPVRDRLAELDFELPAGRAGDDVRRRTHRHHAGRSGARRCAATCRPDDPLAGYAERLASPAFSWPAAARLPDRQPGRGARLPGPRYLVVDYKTNWLGDVEPTASRCRPGTTGRRRWTR